VLTLKTNCRPWAVALVLLALLAAACTDRKTDPPVVQPPAKQDSIVGLSLLTRLPGTWGGPVVSGTMLGSFDPWFVDFRHIAPGYVCGKNELDKQNDIYLGFFVATHNGTQKLYLRNGGYFAGNQRVSYGVLDSLRFDPNGTAYYRFVDAKGGGGRTRVELTFRPDSLIVLTHVNNRFHFRWASVRTDTAVAAAARQQYGTPPVADFIPSIFDITSAFASRSDATLFQVAPGAIEGDPYPTPQHPVLGQLTVNYTVPASPAPTAASRVYIVLTTRKLFNGFVPNMAQLRYRSRYVIANPQDAQFVFGQMHPGTYYLNVLYDVNGDGQFTTGDYIDFTFDRTVTLGTQQTATATAAATFAIP